MKDIGKWISEIKAEAEDPPPQKKKNPPHGTQPVIIPISSSFWHLIDKRKVSFGIDALMWWVYGNGEVTGLSL